jgi:hypothetical protein
MCNQEDKENSEYENFDNVAANPLMLFNCSGKEGRLQEPYKFPESANILSLTSVFQNNLPLTVVIVIVFLICMSTNKLLIVL